MKRVAGLAGMLAMSLGVAMTAAPAAIADAGPSGGSKNTKRSIRKRAVGSIAQRNRWTGKPHEDKRAMARLERQHQHLLTKMGPLDHV